MIDQENKYPVEFLGWGIVPDEIVKITDTPRLALEDESDPQRNEFLMIGIRRGFSEEQIVALYEAIERIGYCLKDMADAILKALQPMVEWIKSIDIDELKLYFDSPKKKKIYRAEYRVKSNVNNYKYKQNYRKKMFCVGGYGNFRRF